MEKLFSLIRQAFFIFDKWEQSLQSIEHDCLYDISKEFSNMRFRRVYSFVLVVLLMCNCINFQMDFVEAQSQLAVEQKVDVRVKTTKHIIVCVDGVGYSTILKMREEGRFKMFQEPSRMVSPFPTLTNLSLSSIMNPVGANETSGYEDNYFDWNSNKLKGGLFDRFNESSFIKGTFRELFDYHPSAIKSGLGYALPPFSTYIESLSDVFRLKQKIKSSNESVFFAYTGATDSLAHLGGEKMVRGFLRYLDDALTDIVRDSKEQTRVTLFSDHGNHYRKYKRAGLKETLKRGGFKIENKINDDRSIVMPQFGLIGCALLFSREKNEEEIAARVSKIEGVDFAAYEDDSIVHLLSNNGTATIEKKGEKFRYKSAGDPLDLLSVQRELNKQRKTDEDGFALDEEWFSFSCGNEKPDSVRRVYDGVTSLVKNRATVIVNFEDGYYTGSKVLDVFAFLQATHGNLGKEQSLGFVMSTENDLPDYIRAENLWSAIGSPVLKKSAITLQ